MTPEELRVVGELRALAESGRARAIRIERRVGLRELARAIGASPSAVSRWETGLNAPRGTAALKWARFLGLPEAGSKRTSGSTEEAA